MVSSDQRVSMNQPPDGYGRNRTNATSGRRKTKLRSRLSDDCFSQSSNQSVHRTAPDRHIGTPRHLKVGPPTLRVEMMVASNWHCRLPRVIVLVENRFDRADTAAETTTTLTVQQ
jgi:hypothetical protein